MPNIYVDPNAKKILDRVKKYLRKKGINASYSDAIRELFHTWRDVVQDED